MAAGSGSYGLDWKQLPIMSFVTTDWSSKLLEHGGFQRAISGSLALGVLHETFRRAARLERRGQKSWRIGLGVSFLLASTARLAPLVMLNEDPRSGDPKARRMSPRRGVGICVFAPAAQRGSRRAGRGRTLRCGRRSRRAHTRWGRPPRASGPARSLRGCRLLRSSRGRTWVLDARATSGARERPDRDQLEPSPGSRRLRCRSRQPPFRLGLEAYNRRMRGACPPCLALIRSAKAPTSLSGGPRAAAAARLASV